MSDTSTLADLLDLGYTVLSAERIDEDTAEWEDVSNSADLEGEFYLIDSAIGDSRIILADQEGAPEGAMVKIVLVKKPDYDE